MKNIEIVLRLLLFLIHVAIVAIMINKLGEEMSKPIDILLVLVGGIFISILVVSMLFHLVDLIKNFKKLTQ